VSEIEKYYKNDVFGDVDSKHILVKIDKDNSKGLSDADAKKLAKEIISKLNSGKTWDEVVTEYKDKIVSEELGYQAFNASLEKAYLQECKNLEVGKYSKNPVLTSYGYHIVFKIAQKDKPKLNDVKDYISISQIKDSQKKYPNIEFCSHSYDLHVRGSVESKKLSELEKDIKQYEKSMGKCKYFAYPFGHYTNEMIESLKSHDYKLAFIFEMPKKVKKNENDYLIPRINTSFSQSTFKFFLKIILPFIY
jgi:hypothetical protein